MSPLLYFTNPMGLPDNQNFQRILIYVNKEACAKQEIRNKKDTETFERCQKAGVKHPQFHAVKGVIGSLSAVKNNGIWVPSIRFGSSKEGEGQHFTWGETFNSSEECLQFCYHEFKLRIFNGMRNMDRKMQKDKRTNFLLPRHNQ